MSFLNKIFNGSDEVRDAVAAQQSKNKRGEGAPPFDYSALHKSSYAPQISDITEAPEGDIQAPKEDLSSKAAQVKEKVTGILSAMQKRRLQRKKEAAAIKAARQRQQDALNNKGAYLSQFKPSQVRGSKHPKAQEKYGWPLKFLNNQ